MARNESSLVRGKKGDDISNLSGLADMWGQVMALEHCACRSRHVSQQALCRHQAYDDDSRAYALLAVLSRQILCQVDQRGLRGAVSRLTKVALGAFSGARHDDG